MCQYLQLVYNSSWRHNRNTDKLILNDKILLGEGEERCDSVKYVNMFSKWVFLLLQENLKQPFEYQFLLCLQWKPVFPTYLFLLSGLIFPRCPLCLSAPVPQAAAAPYLLPEALHLKRKPFEKKKKNLTSQKAEGFQSYQVNTVNANLRLQKKNMSGDKYTADIHTCKVIICKNIHHSSSVLHNYHSI